MDSRTSLRVVQPRVLGARHQLEVVEGVVRGIAIPVVNHLVGSEAAAEVKLHDADVLAEHVTPPRPRVPGVSDVRLDVALGMHRSASAPLRVLRPALSAQTLGSGPDAPACEVVADGLLRHAEPEADLSERLSLDVGLHEAVDLITGQAPGASSHGGGL